MTQYLAILLGMATLVASPPLSSGMETRWFPHLGPPLQSRQTGPLQVSHHRVLGLSWSEQVSGHTSHSPPASLSGFPTCLLVLGLVPYIFSVKEHVL